MLPPTAHTNASHANLEISPPCQPRPPPPRQPRGARGTLRRLAAAATLHGDAPQLPPAQLRRGARALTRRAAGAPRDGQHMTCTCTRTCTCTCTCTCTAHARAHAHAHALLQASDPMVTSHCNPSPPACNPAPAGERRDGYLARRRHDQRLCSAPRRLRARGDAGLPGGAHKVHT